MKEIQIKNVVMMVDDEDFEHLSSLKWYLNVSGTGKVYPKARGFNKEAPNKKFYAHRIILGLNDPRVYVDHKDQNPLNNQKSNLRVVTKSQNSQNRGATIMNSNGFKGIYKNSKNSYAARITVGGRKIWGGSFASKELAAKRYNELARIHHGEFAYQNPV